MSEIEVYDAGSPQFAISNIANISDQGYIENYEDRESKLNKEKNFSFDNFKNSVSTIANDITINTTKISKYDLNLSGELSHPNRQQQHEASKQNMKLSPHNSVPLEKLVQSRRNFKRDECIKFQNSVFEVTRRHQLKVKSVSSPGSTINVEFFDQPDVTVVDTVKSELLSLLNLEEDQIQMIEGSSSENIVLTTDIGKVISSKRDDTKTKLGGVVWVKFADSKEEIKQFGLSCGHDKHLGDKITIVDEAEENTSMPQDNSDFLRKRFNGSVVFSVSNNYYDVVCQLWRTVDASLIDFPVVNAAIRYAEEPTHRISGIDIEPYVIRNISTQSNLEQLVRVYINGVYESNSIDKDMFVEIFDEYGRKGRVVDKFYTAVGDFLTPPCYNTFTIVSAEEEDKALHGLGDSGLLVTTVLNETNLLKDEEGNYIGSVKAVGMLIAAQPVNNEKLFKFSLALPLQEALEELKKCAKIKDLAIKDIQIVGRESPNSIAESVTQTTIATGTSVYRSRNRNDSTTDYEQNPGIDLGSETSNSIK